MKGLLVITHLDQRIQIWKNYLASIISSHDNWRFIKKTVSSCCFLLARLAVQTEKVHVREDKKVSIYLHKMIAHFLNYTLTI